MQQNGGQKQRVIRQVLSVVFVTAVSMTMAACGSVQMPEVFQPAPTSPADSAAALENRIGELPAQRLGAGQCATFLWTRNIDRKLVLFASAADGYARMFVDGRQQDLPLASTGGQSMMGQSEQQRYVWRDLAIDVDAKFERRAGLARGAVIPQGTLRLSNREGWEYVVPVAGLVACGE